MTNICKVLLLVENVSAPADRRVWPEAVALRDNGLQVSIISPRGRQSDREAAVCIDGITIYRYTLPVIGNKYLAYLAEYSISVLMTFLLSLKVWRTRGFDVIHAANPPDTFFLIGLFYRLFGKKYIFDQHDLSPELFQVKFGRRPGLLHKILLFCERCSYRSAHLVITSNLSQKRFAIERGHCRPERVFVVRNGPDLRHLQPMAPEPELKGERPYVLGYIGLMAVQDCVENCLYVMDELVHKRGRQDVSLLLIGGGERFSAIEALAHELQLTAYVRFAGIVQPVEIARYLSVADIGLIPDPQNGMNEHCTMIKTMEYMALGKPIVAFDLAETRYSAQEAGLYATPNLIEDFADKVEQLLEDRARRLQMGAYGRQRVATELQWDVSKRYLLLAYKTLFPTRVRLPAVLSPEPEATSGDVVSKNA
ncbi:MAG TPA: glycosyltransferase family 4 protein [Ktedonobacteraceae bacterium]|jgi:glycosyltransferase involved in cell wall biosynthesis